MAIQLQSSPVSSNITTGYKAPAIKVPTNFSMSGLTTPSDVSVKNGNISGTGFPIGGTYGTPTSSTPATPIKKEVPVVTAKNATVVADKAKEVVNKQETTQQPYYDTQTGELTPAGKAAGATPMKGGNVITTTEIKPKVETPLPTPEQTIADMPETGFQKAYDLKTGERKDQPIGILPDGFSTQNPTVRTDVSNSVTDTTNGVTYKQFTDGTYGRFDSQGNYSPATPGAFSAAQQGEKINNQINSIINGNFQLPASQQAQITALQANYNDAIQQQQTVNANAQGGASLMANMSGLAGSSMGSGLVQATVENGIRKIASLQAEMAGKIGEMKTAFEKDDMTMLQTSYTQYLNAQNNIQKEINDTATKVQAQKDKQDLKDQTYALNQATKYRDTKEPISQFDSPAEVDRKIQTSEIYQNELKTKTGEVDPEAIKGMVESYKVTGQVPSFSGLMGAPQRAAFWAAVGGNSGIIGQANTNKYALKAASTALDNQTKIGKATQTAVDAMEGGLQLAEKWSKATDRSGSPILNKYLLWTKGQLGASDAETMTAINNFDAAITTVSQEYAKIMTGAAASIAGTTVSSQADAKEFINKELTQKQFEGVADILRADAKIRLTSYDSTIKSIKDDIQKIGESGNTDNVSTPTGTTQTTTPLTANTVW